MTDLSRLGPILVTGSGGFIGRHLVSQLASFGGDVQEVINRRHCDLRDRDAVERKIERVQPKVVIHLTATPDRYAGPDAATDEHQNTVTSAANLVAALRGHDALVVHAGSYKQYGHRPLPFSESMTVWPTSRYATNKHIAESLILDYGRRHLGGAVALRIGPVFGPGQKSDRLVPVLFRALIGDDAPCVRVTSAPSDLTYVSDVVRAVVEVLDTPAARGRILNISRSRASTPAEVARMIGGVLGLSASEVNRRVCVVGETSWPCLGDISMACALLQWRPRVSLEDGIRTTVEALLTKQSTTTKGDPMDLVAVDST